MRSEKVAFYNYQDLIDSCLTGGYACSKLKTAISLLCVIVSDIFLHSLVELQTVYSMCETSDSEQYIWIYATSEGDAEQTAYFRIQ